MTETIAQRVRREINETCFPRRDDMSKTFAEMTNEEVIEMVAEFTQGRTPTILDLLQHPMVLGPVLRDEFTHPKGVEGADASKWISDAYGEDFPLDSHCGREAIMLFRSFNTMRGMFANAGRRMKRSMVESLCRDCLRTIAVICFG